LDPDATIYDDVSTEDLHKAWKDNKSVVAGKYESFMETVPNPVLGLILDKLIDFNTICAELTVQGLSENFWQVASSDRI